jgi:hypothetical protein
MFGEREGNGGAKTLPVEGGGDLECHLRDRDGGYIANGKTGSSSKVRGSGGEVQIEIPSREGNGGAFGIRDGGDSFFRRSGRFAGTELGRRIFVALKKDLALRIGWSRLLSHPSCRGTEENGEYGGTNH